MKVTKRMCVGIASMALVGACLARYSYQESNNSIGWDDSANRSLQRKLFMIENRMSAFEVFQPRDQQIFKMNQEIYTPNAKKKVIKSN